MPDPNLIKMADLARRSGVPAATIKHYLREGLLPSPTVRTGRNMAYYDAGLIPRICEIKELQRTRFLPLKVIRELLGEPKTAPAEVTQAAIERVLKRVAPAESRTRAALLESGMLAAELDWLCSLGVVQPEGTGLEETYSGDDLKLLRTLGAARRAGLRADMLPVSILEPYMRAIQDLVRVELTLFKKGVFPKAEGDLAELVDAATTLSEQLVVLLRRKMLLPTLRELVGEETKRGARGRRTAAATSRRKRR